MSDTSKKRPNEPLLVEISDEALRNLLDKNLLTVGKDIRVIKSLEIRAGAIVARQYDR